MRTRTTSGIIGLVGLTLALSGCSSPPLEEGLLVPVSTPHMAAQIPDHTQATAMTGFSERLFDAVMAANDGKPNPVFSPMSAFMALALMGNGASGDTAQAFETTLGMDKETANSIAAWVMQDLTQPGEGTTLNLANSAWFDSRLTVKQSFVDEASSYYQADIYNRELATGQTRSQVNSWVDVKTRGLIPSVLDKNVKGDVMALLINTVFLEAKWDQPFDSLSSQRAPFTKDDQVKETAWYMANHFSDIPYISTNDVEGVLLPYQDGRLAYLAVMPNTGGLDSLKLDGTSMSEWLAAAEKVDGMSVMMPKFHTEFPTQLKQPLIDMGLGVAFSDSPDFVGIAEKTDDTNYVAKISDVVQKVSMDVGEEGTKAVSATVVHGGGPGAPGFPELVMFDHPYLYGIIDTQTGLPLFLGAMTDPSMAPPTK